MRASHYNQRVDGDLEWRVVRAWHAAFLLLKFEPCQPFLADAGIPPPMVADSRDLPDPARRFVRGTGEEDRAVRDRIDRFSSTH
jgi:hypothetical protein